MISHLAFDKISVDTISLATNNEISVDVLRLDKLNPVISGNKWFKLRYYLEEARSQHKKGIITFGGAWSNHIIATAAACQINGLRSIGIIRGEEAPQLSNTLQHAKEWGMQLLFISRTAYQLKEIPASIPSEDYYIINEGGYGIGGAKGASTILEHCDNKYTHYCCAVGTGTMMAGIINHSSPDKKTIGISVMKNNTRLEEMIQKLVVNKNKSSKLIHDYPFGGYAKHQPALLQFMNEFYRRTGIPSDFVYTAKLFYGISDLIKKNYFPPGSRLLLIHSGGLQGNNSLPQGALIF
ncbi:MAG: pyridoxal-phosphate dependent enzyme [Chitinophagaceae bacterium]